MLFRSASGLAAVLLLLEEEDEEEDEDEELAGLLAFAAVSDFGLSDDFLSALSALASLPSLPLLSLSLSFDFSLSFFLSFLSLSPLSFFSFFFFGSLRAIQVSCEENGIQASPHDATSSFELSQFARIPLLSAITCSVRAETRKNPPLCPSLLAPRTALSQRASVSAVKRFSDAKTVPEQQVTFHSSPRTLATSLNSKSGRSAFNY